MTLREQLILKSIFGVLGNMLHGQSDQNVLRASVELLVPRLMRTEYEQVLILAESKGWLNGLPTAFGSVKYSLTDAGRAAAVDLGG